MKSATNSAALRTPAVAGQFYTANPQALREEVEAYLQRGTRRTARTLLTMAPHAGYMYSGKTAGCAFGSSNLAHTIYLLGPNHTGRGAPISVWSGGDWQTPLGAVPVNTQARDELLASSTFFEADTLAHLDEHSLEVLLPFIQVANPAAKIVPIAIATSNQETLAFVGAVLASALQKNPDSGIVVSSDMSHYISAEEAKKLDTLALSYVQSVDALGLLSAVSRNNISMCGVLPMTAALLACETLGATKAELIEYTNSGVVSGDASQVVGYAGAIIDRP
ncbi:AmmeMemoRadiSam system protein B [Halodesulfovibrio spirochaetisodalis]|uniref:MEMO1 family protein SP90_11910 n=1 Tax=Halodesulfovibrio spirochaetisodalis TaxID=1560234 RepID=A0A1B7XAY3_9BACT|nr:AmmeMemoRadiSam system protein B [Halodesulfovibrio spirochaetisodalis]OBQ46496.1 Mediator of ErbB2-driven cell motility-containing protein [Halodesulfovibrio spirochaetisodalis]